jgi:hypothetical protein
MPLGNPHEGTQFESPIEDGTYAVYCIGITDGQNHGFGPTINWDFHVYDRAAETQVLLSNGEPYVLGELSGEKVTRSAKGNSKAYDWATALIGESIDNMSGEQIAAAVEGKWAVATIVINDKGFPKIVENGLKPWAAPRTAAPPRAAAPARGPRQPVAAGVTEEEAPPFE